MTPRDTCNIFIPHQEGHIGGGGSVCVCRSGW